MKHEELRKLKAGDKVIVKIDHVDYEADDGRTVSAHSFIPDKYILGIYHEPTKIKMTVGEKKEFNVLHERCNTLLQDIISVSVDNNFPNLSRLLFGSKSDADNNLGQLKFARALANPELIEVIEPEKHLVTLPNGQYVTKAEAGAYQIFSDCPRDTDKLTKEEAYEAEKQLHLTGLVKLWEETSKREVKENG